MSWPQCVVYLACIIGAVVVILRFTGNDPCDPTASEMSKRYPEETEDEDQ